MPMHGSLAYARIINRLDTDELHRFLADDEFPRIITWLARHRRYHAEVEQAVGKLLAELRARCH